MLTALIAFCVLNRKLEAPVTGSQERSTELVNVLTREEHVSFCVVPLTPDPPSFVFPAA